MTNANDLRNIVYNDPAVRDDMYRFHKNNDLTLQALSDYDGRRQFEVQMMDPRGSQLLLNMYLPEYARRNQPAPQQAAPPATPQQVTAAAKEKMRKAAIIGATGLVAVILGSTIDSEQSRVLFQNAGSAAVVGGGLLAAYYYITT